ncbi:IS1634 family transposase [Lachnoanaerobaculum gingivalis]|uniref:IS1634 family transposase n=1 Tax=Lachnoanaerobaculum gingivalis TaxID=2490855 RepID=A0A3P3QY60_9FIRM|nr:IS1634 family transposase [Lachnoanaerobaculum gingivalis]RRJ25448.1 IS1634 family transposase [Lachnoanaerobaculum gingivalis]RRJ25923.1 IS1634 family transposase [Lachnoanaerobaculum gingivalis]RRJ26034.1 IS1634 family transposase [Lachnoanaerobaculum gingivalis]RRJ26850.1 IS1634 family transposase [Lachnoanaerobaculum gingivalis]RRJ27093.1 IS1634 family transposase [Lachnoanaerobaculum gingivalis]
MKLWYDKKSKDPTYFIQRGIRNGKKTTTKNVVRIGKHSELLKTTADPLAYALDEVKRYNEELKNNKSVALDFKFDFNEKITYQDDLVSKSKLLNIGYFFLQQIYHDLKIGAFFKNIIKDTRIQFDPNLVNRFLTYSRILNPDSKLGTHQNLVSFYEQPTFGYEHILRTLDIMYDHYDEYISHLYDASTKLIKRDTSVCFFDCSNYYFEIESNDEDYIDPVTGEVTKGLRKYGVSKEHRPNPIVQMGLFMDKDGIPLSMCITSGSDNEQTTAIPLEQKLITMFKGKKFIYCADAGLGSLNIRNFNSMGGRAFIVTQSIKMLSNTLKEAIFSDIDYRLLSNDKPATIQQMKDFDRFDKVNAELYDDRIYKIIPADKAFDLGLYEEKACKNGTIKKVKSKAVVPQKIIVSFSRKMMEYQRFIRNRQIERAKKLLTKLDPETYKKGANDITRFIKRTTSTSSGEKAVDTYELNQEAINEEEKYDGFYAVATNLEDSAKYILEISSNRYKIEDCFRIMKTNFSARPVFHQNRERIVAHFMVCYTALLIYRILEKKLDMYGTHFTVENVIETLNNMQVANLEDVCYMSTYDNSQVLTSLNAIFNLELDKKYYQPKDLNKKIKKIST